LGVGVALVPFFSTIIMCIKNTCLIGAVAQLAERVVRNDKARGSIPLCSTRSKSYHQMMQKGEIIQYFERFIAWRYLRSRKKDGFVSVISTFSFLGIALGVATLIVVMSVMNGFRYELMNRILGFNSHLTVMALNHQQVDLDTIKTIPGVKSANPVLDKQAICRTEHGVSGAIVRCVNPSDLMEKKLISENIVQGSLTPFLNDGGGGDGTHVVMGYKLARTLGVNPGGIVSVMGAEGEPTAFGTVPRTQNCRVAALFDSGMHEYDSAFLVMTLTEGKDLFDVETVRDHEVFLNNPEHIAQVKDAILALGGVSIHDWRETNSHFFKAIQVQSNVMFLILTLIVVVAAFNIVSCLVMLVKDKTRDIAILRTLGVSQGGIMRIFCYVGLCIGGFGTVFGGALGLLFASNIDGIRRGLEALSGVDLFRAEIYFLSTLPVRIDAKEVIMVVLMALLCSFLATLYPAWKASRLKPVEGLRYE
jgi:lipoprotein-releasing system permease protein